MDSAPDSESNSTHNAVVSVYKYADNLTDLQRAVLIFRTIELLERFEPNSLGLAREGDLVTILSVSNLYTDFLCSLVDFKRRDPSISSQDSVRDLQVSSTNFSFDRDECLDDAYLIFLRFVIDVLETLFVLRPAEVPRTLVIRGSVNNKPGFKRSLDSSAGCSPIDRALARFCDEAEKVLQFSRTEYQRFRSQKLELLRSRGKLQSDLNSLRSNNNLTPTRPIPKATAAMDAITPVRSTSSMTSFISTDRTTPLSVRVSSPSRSKAKSSQQLGMVAQPNASSSAAAKMSLTLLSSLKRSFLSDLGSIFTLETKRDLLDQFETFGTRVLCVNPDTAEAQGECSNTTISTAAQEGETGHTELEITRKEALANSGTETKAEKSPETASSATTTATVALDALISDLSQEMKSIEVDKGSQAVQAENDNAQSISAFRLEDYKSEEVESDHLSKPNDDIEDEPNDYSHEQEPNVTIYDTPPGEDTTSSNEINRAESIVEEVDMPSAIDSSHQHMQEVDETRAQLSLSSQYEVSSDIHQANEEKTNEDLTVNKSLDAEMSHSNQTDAYEVDHRTRNPYMLRRHLRLIMFKLRSHLVDIEAEPGYQISEELRNSVKVAVSALQEASPTPTKYSHLTSPLAAPQGHRAKLAELLSKIITRIQDPLLPRPSLIEMDPEPSWRVGDIDNVRGLLDNPDWKVSEHVSHEELNNLVNLLRKALSEMNPRHDLDRLETVITRFKAYGLNDELSVLAKLDLIEKLKAIVSSMKESV